MYNVPCWQPYIPICHHTFGKFSPNQFHCLEKFNLRGKRKEVTAKDWTQSYKTTQNKMCVCRDKILVGNVPKKPILTSVSWSGSFQDGFSLSTRLLIVLDTLYLHTYTVEWSVHNKTMETCNLRCGSNYHKSLIITQLPWCFDEYTWVTLPVHPCHWFHYLLHQPLQRS